MFLFSLKQNQFFEKALDYVTMTKDFIPAPFDKLFELKLIKDTFIVLTPYAKITLNESRKVFEEFGKVAFELNNSKEIKMSTSNQSSINYKPTVEYA
jgi:hypothetical protein